MSDGVFKYYSNIFMNLIGLLLISDWRGPDFDLECFKTLTFSCLAHDTDSWLLV